MRRFDVGGIGRSAIPKPIEKFVLLAAPLTTASNDATDKAEKISRGMSAELVTLRVSGPTTYVRPLSTIDGRPSRRFGPECSLSQVTRGHWLLNRRGDFLSVVAETSLALSPAFVLIPGIHGLNAADVRELAFECRAPVLLVREARTSDAIVATTNLELPTFPVLRAGAVLASSLGGRAVFHHNLTPEVSGQPPTKGPHRSVLRRLEDLAEIAATLGVECENVVTVRRSPSDALLSVVDRERPDVIVVGTRNRKTSHPPRASFAEGVLDAVSTSVLVVPVSANDAETAMPYGIS
ncbi:MAG TPA: universal stress protein [Polyangiaceae bacterium]|nr:universal stress protein [Polyangiaceae bacterium]